MGFTVFWYMQYYLVFTFTTNDIYKIKEKLWAKKGEWICYQTMKRILDISEKFAEKGID